MTTLRQIFSIAELRKKLFFTFALLAACRIGVFIPVPGINGERAVAYFKQLLGSSQNLFQLADIFSGGAFAQMTVIALGVVPYISASIIVQLLLVFMPSIQREMRESPDQGKRKIGRLTRLFTVGLAFIQSLLFAKFALKMNMAIPGIVLPTLLSSKLFGAPWIFYLTTVIVMTTGTLLLMWIGEQISDKGIGNGVSLIISLGILASFPSVLGSIVNKLNLGSQDPSQLGLFSLLLLCLIFVFVLVTTILIIEGVRKIPVQYARRVIGRREIPGGGSYLPLKVNYAGVIPVIFASSLLMFPATIGQFMSSDSSWLKRVAMMLSPGSWVYSSCYVLLIIFFTYFWTATQFHPEQIASEMKKNNAFIPGIRQGKPTQTYLEYTMNRVTLLGAVFLAVIAILPSILGRVLNVDANVSYFLGGTAMLIVVGVVLDTMKQVDAFLLMRRYDSFLKKDRSKGRH
ncbi:preprotein translocase, SecY subunit [Chlamydia psittaci 09DC78]|uniref:preprotein translocase subunit SecY n=1 Tax=Chlamydia psittaci TaxID=83554 RepID=UPI00035283EF|nr:preprotein translocase subunit SecY [Chlamydia psittaci]EPJ25462.1 preprotein translocase, SecY subunit [Chlamydia psittaci 09DC77]EPJ26950.1 preprotein translocase, SecY subunit [Chlamydia psittaci 09DC80]EPJ30445.1 preprotein translocase, SecY subunit [Chlamydia psittaci 09DC78]EPL01482.1 preprotein translocase, SecY subunit [Chlamydia psittaci 09DC79]